MNVASPCDGYMSQLFSALMSLVTPSSCFNASDYFPPLFPSSGPNALSSQLQEEKKLMQILLESRIKIED